MGPCTDGCDFGMFNEIEKCEKYVHVQVAIGPEGGQEIEVKDFCRSPVALFVFRAIRIRKPIINTVRFKTLIFHTLMLIKVQSVAVQRNWVRR